MHRAAPRFGMRVVEIYETAGFPILVLEAKKEFAARYALDGDYWRRFDVAEAPEVLAYLKANLADLASHYHALYQDEELADDQPAHFDEATRWYRAYLSSFPTDPGAPDVNHRLADLLLENGEFANAALEYERTAYDYTPHEGAGAAGYAAIFARREHEKQASDDSREEARREAVASSLRFVERFPAHAHAASVLGAAVDDLYEMKELERALAHGQQLIDDYAEADAPIRRGAWTVVAHASIDVADYVRAESAYVQVLDMTEADDETRASIEDNLAAAIYKQGEQASQAGENRSAAAHFLRVAEAAPHSGIRASAEYDAAAALIQLEDWAGAAAVLETFRESHPEHELAPEATKQLARVYRATGDLLRAGTETERIADEADDVALQRDALLVAAQLYDGAAAADRALAVRLRYVEEFPEPIETAVETRSTIAAVYEKRGDQSARLEQLREIVEIDARAGRDRSERTRFLAARAALALAERSYAHFTAVALVQPFDVQLREKQQRMREALDAFGALVDYEVGDVTAAATFYMAEIYGDFSRALHDSERPRDLGATELAAYELALEEEAFPFEEQSIQVHEKNLELMRSGLYNAWIEKSLSKLVVLMPGRYAKPEVASPLLASIEGYVYQPPSTPSAPTALADDAESASPEGGETEVPPPASLADESGGPDEETR
jgi:outer membrane protein assembly factor BamD (BamD/ComL family)